ncbi:MAG: Gamma-glutamylputrescine oxidoreductase [Alphaproteobacteria bacterium MarineAlpha5_Bin12]|nr:MAG: Gamma-glutamylputrescine oxidoreductase [Alphaproteobacteria bacterium MarineAlpha5_Bin12]|tara:strand:- start:5605 stop:6945 length:1341 start_codon:yes stop_codon:yes gene_type:complete
MSNLYHHDMYDFNTPIKSYWEKIKTKDEFDSKQLNSDIKSDVVVIGGGYTGLSCALQLSKKFNFSVSVLEAGHIGFGSSARNAGFLCINPTKLSIKQMINKYGIDETKYFYRNQIDGSNYTKELINEYDINCDLVGNLNYEVAHHPSFINSLKEHSDDLKKYFNIKSQFYSQEEFNKIGHTGNEQFGAISYEPGCALNPLKFLLGLAKANYLNNVKLFKNSKVIKVEKNIDKYKVITNNGSITANKIVFSVNAFYKDDFLPIFRNRIIPAISNIIVTRPLTNDELSNYNFVTYNPILNARNLLFYYRLLPDKRILFGARGDLSGSKNSSLKMSLWIEKRFKEVFPKWQKIKVDFRWGGFVAFTREFSPSLGKIPNEQIYHSFGYHANGVNTAPWCGKELANFIGGSNHNEMRISKIFQGLPKKFPLPFLRLFLLKIVYIYYSLIDK